MTNYILTISKINQIVNKSSITTFHLCTKEGEKNGIEKSGYDNKRELNSSFD